MSRWAILFLLVLLPTALFAQNWTQHTVATDISYPNWFALADLNNDGTTDIAASANESWSLIWWSNASGTGLDWTEYAIEGSVQGVQGFTCCDVNGDSDPDFIGSYPAASTGSITHFENADGTGTDWDETYVVTGDEGPYNVCAADIDIDGDQDFYAAYYLSNTFSWWENTDGSGMEWALHDIAVHNWYGAYTVAAADLDGDGDSDCIGTSLDEWKLYWFRNDDGAGTTWTEFEIDPSFGGASYAEAVDIDGDGDLDILGAGTSCTYIVFWTNDNGDGSAWTRHEVGSNLHSPVHACAADLDGDGDMDIAASDTQGGAVRIWLNADEVGGNWDEYVVSDTYEWAGWIGAVDLNGDGHPDLVTGSVLSSDVVWFENPGTLGVDDPDQNRSSVVNGFTLAPAYPNPFNASTTLLVHLPAASSVTLTVYNIVGKAVMTLGDENLAAGTHAFTLAADNLASGEYFVRATTSGQWSEFQKVVLLR